MKVVRVYFTPTQIEADEVVFVTDDHYNADYAAYPVQAIDAQRRVFRTDNRYDADSVIVMTGNAMNPYVEHRGGYYNGGGRTHGDRPGPSHPEAANTSSASSTYGGGALDGVGVIVTLTRVLAFGVALLAVVLGVLGLLVPSLMGSAIIAGIVAVGLWVGGGAIGGSGRGGKGSASKALAKDAGSLVFMVVYFIGNLFAIFVAPVLALITLLSGNLGGAIGWLVFAAVIYLGGLYAMDHMS